MQVIHLEAAIIFGVFILQISSIFSISSPASDCLATVDTCMSDLCRHERAFDVGNCEGEGCQIKGSETCNMTIQTALDQFPSLRGCVCGWEEELCDSIQVLASQCTRTPAVQQKRSTMRTWQPSSFRNIAYDGAGSCVDRISVCVGDSVCNRHLAPLLQACMTEQCDSDRCQQKIQQFYSNMPQDSAEMLVMCECEASDQTCLLMKTGLQSGACGDETRICQERLDQCAEDSSCRDLLKTLRAKCWSTEEAQCSERNPQRDECLMLKHPDLILGTNSECKRAFLATLGTVLHHPCTCKGLHSDHLLTCRMIQEVFHNRSYFITVGESSDGPSEIPKIHEPEHALTWSYDNLLYTVAAALFVGVVIIMPLAVFSKIWLLKRRDQIKLCHPQKRNCAVLL